MTATEAWKGIPAITPKHHFLADGGEMGEKIGAFDWSGTELGAMDDWPLSLKTTTRLVLTSKQPMCFFWGSDLICFYNDAFKPMLGQRLDGALARPFKDLWSDVWDDLLPYTRAALSGKGTWVENLPLVMSRNGYEEQTYWTFSYSPLHGDDGGVCGLLNIVTETTKTVLDRESLNAANGALAESIEDAQRLIEDKIHSEEQQQLLQRELSHRMKNTLSVVQAIVAQTMRHSKTLHEASSTIAGRLIALSRVQDILSETSWASANLRDVVNNALVAHMDKDGRFEISGPPAHISAQQALGISLAIHELATNALKYGALSNEWGRVTIRWSIGNDGAFCFEWCESGGPTVTDPENKGFGSRLVETIVASYFSGRGHLEYAPNGIVFSLVGRLQTGPDGAAAK